MLGLTKMCSVSLSVLGCSLRPDYLDGLSLFFSLLLTSYIAFIHSTKHCLSIVLLQMFSLDLKSSYFGVLSPSSTICSLVSISLYDLLNSCCSIFFLLFRAFLAYYSHAQFILLASLLPVFYLIRLTCLIYLTHFVGQT